MKKLTAAIFISMSLLACKGNPQGAMGANDKPDTSAFDDNKAPTSTPEATKNDSVDKSTGPGSDKTHATDSEAKEKHR